jgi:hypothetical protein
MEGAAARAALCPHSASVACTFSSAFPFSLTPSFFVRYALRIAMDRVHESPIRHLLRPGACFVTGVAIHKSGLVKAKTDVRAYPLLDDEADRADVGSR